MLAFLFGVLASAQASTCDLTAILRSPKPDGKCVEAYLSKIENQEDRAEVKFRLQQWRPMPNLGVTADGGAFEAYDGDKPIFKAIILKTQKPMLIWLDGKIIVDNSENPSIVRRLQNAMKFPKKSAAFDLVVPRAYADQIQVRESLLMMYSVDQGNAWHSASAIVSRDEFGNFLPGNSWISRNLMKTRQIRCSSKGLVEGGDFLYDNTSGVNTQLNITPQSTHEFLIKGLKRGVTHRIRLASNERPPNRYVGLPTAGENMTIETCEDAACTKTSASDKLEDWNLILRNDPAEEAKRAQRARGLNAEVLRDLNQDFRKSLAQRLFALSVMGSCCESDLCRDQITKRWNIQLQAPGSSPTTAH